MWLRKNIFVVSAFFSIILIYLLYRYYNVVPSTSHISSVTMNDIKDINSAIPILYVAVVACGQRLQETLVMIKSALLFNNSKEKLHFLIFAEDQLQTSFNEKLNDWRSQRKDFNFTLYAPQFPKNDKWKTFFKPCATQRLFLPSILQSIESILYVDTDIIFLSPVGDTCKLFGSFSATQIAALISEHEDPRIGWYNRFAHIPYYGPLGVNSGVMLMNLSRMREFKWEEHVLSIHKEYKKRMTLVDQDIINIIFHYNPDKLFLMPCEYNYRPDNCMHMNVSMCNNYTDGIKVMHGNRGYFHSNKQPLFKATFEAIESFQLGGNPYRDFLIPLQKALQNPTVIKSNCGKLTTDVLQQARKLIKNEYCYDT